MRMFPAASKPLVQPSSKLFHVFEAASIVDESSHESFLGHMVPSVTNDQQHNLLSNPLFHQKDLFAPSTIKAGGNVVHLGDGPTIPLRVRWGILLARGGILLPARRVCSRTIRLPMNDSLLLLLVLLCLGDDHKLLHLTSSSSGRSFHQRG